MLAKYKELPLLESDQRTILMRCGQKFRKVRTPACGVMGSLIIGLARKGNVSLMVKSQMKSY